MRKRKMSAGEIKRKVKALNASISRAWETELKARKRRIILQQKLYEIEENIPTSKKSNLVQDHVVRCIIAVLLK